jgi:hypothetical protein
MAKGRQISSQTGLFRIFSGNVPVRGFNGADRGDSFAAPPKARAVVHLLPKPLHLNRIFTPQ